jgi:hypothetical protein
MRQVDGGAHFEPASDKPVDVSQSCPVNDDNNFGRVHGIAWWVLKTAQSTCP